MDDLFSILIYIIIIISFLSSIFKKKPKPGPPEQPRRVPQDRVPEGPSVPEEQYGSTDGTDYDIMREIENMFKTEEQKIREAQQRKTKIEEAAGRTEIKSPPERISYEDYVAQGGIAYNKSVRDYSENKVDRNEHEYSTGKRRTLKIDSKIEEQARKFQELLEKRSYHQEKFTGELVRKIKNPETFREYILVSEILARPKALRR